MQKMALSHTEIKQRVLAFAEACRRQGHRATHQRMEIFRELAGTDEHPDAETIYRRVRRRIPAISLDTVYRTLNWLESQGAIARVVSARERARFDANTARHHHFVCRACGMMGDFTSEALDRLPAPPAVAAMGRVDTVYVEWHGLCRKCQSGNKQPKTQIGGKK